MGWQEKLKEYIDKQELIWNDKDERATANIVRDIEKNELFEMWELLNTECREETEKVKNFIKTILLRSIEEMEKELKEV